MTGPMTIPDPFTSGMYPICPASHDVGLTRLFDVATLLSLLGCRPGDVVLDLGAGPGFSAETMARLGYDVVAVDPDIASLRSARGRPTFDPTRIEGTVRAVVGVAERLPIATGKCDGVLGMHVLHHLADLDAAIDELARVLAPGARAVFCEPGLDHLLGLETQRAIREHGEDDRPFDPFRFMETALARGFSRAQVPATVQPPGVLISAAELDTYRTGALQRGALSPAGLLDELQRRRAYVVLDRSGTRPPTSRRPGTLAAVFEIGALPPRLRRDVPVGVDVVVTNVGDSRWLSAPSRRGGYVTLGCKLLALDGRLVDAGLDRTFLDADVLPGERRQLTARIRVPAHVPLGRYELVLDMVDELVCWFADVDPRRASRHEVELEA